MAVGQLLLLLLSTGCITALKKQNVTERCLVDTNSFLWELKQSRPKEYAVAMFDAFGKMGSNVKGGNVNQPGLLQECRSVHGPSFSGQYCQVFLRQETFVYFVGICVPDSCKEEDLQLLVLDDSFQFGKTPLLPPLPSIFINQSSQELITVHCLPSSVSPGIAEVTCLFVCCVMVALPLAATLFTALVRWQRNRVVSPKDESCCLNPGLDVYGSLRTDDSSSSCMNGSEVKQHTRKNPMGFPGHIWWCLQTFSLHTTTQGVLSISGNEGSYSSLNGIRVLSLLWIMCGHSVQFPVVNNLDNYKDWRSTVESSPLHVLAISGPIFLAVDTFLLLGGLLSARTLLRSIHQAEDTLSPSLVANYLLKRITRIQPLHMFIICLAIGLISVIQWGPFWFPFLNTLTDCKAYWWANLLLVSNLLPVHEICVPWTWYLSLDFQCYITTPLLVYIYRLSKGVFTVVAGVLMLLTILSGSLVTAVMHLPVFQPSTLTSDDYAMYYYVKPYTRYGPFLIGILTGIYMTMRQDKLLLKKWQAALGWFLCLASMALVVGLAYALRETPSGPSLQHALYQGLHRHVWALAVTWIILACEEGFGGFVKTLLSLRVWTPLANISFACYLTHPLFIILYISLQETPIHYTNINFMYMFLSHLVLTLVVSLLLTILVERPYIVQN
ncbi:O-acyltransferase like protein [Synchiropus splendidus]|uniref:O-acyltransferase like protein n=1 Tax=Synchiropus splendidus TaxID=270530 RepID=UPI00237E5A70|nr:O-acyltransferase like protein [Synchiropus splendidus]